MKRPPPQIPVGGGVEDGDLSKTLQPVPSSEAKPQDSGRESQAVWSEEAEEFCLGKR